MRSMRLRLAAGAAAIVVVAVGVTAAEAAQADAVIPPLARIMANQNILFNRATSAVFTPRGANFVRLAPLPEGRSYHSTFEPGRYNPQEAELVLSKMDELGYNVVRVFIDGGVDSLGEKHGLAANAATAPGGLNAAYLGNVRDFVARAIPHGIYVLPTTEGYPHNAFYANIISTVDHGPGPVERPGDVNVYFTDRGHVVAKREYMRYFAAEMSARLGPYRTGILAYEIDNEAFWNASYAPFNLMDGEFTVLDGPTYHMRNLGERRRAAQDSMVIYVNNAVAGVKASDPDAMVTIGMSTNYGVGKTDFNQSYLRNCYRPAPPTPDPCGDPADPYWRVPAEPANLARWSAIDFIDVHIYPLPGGYSVAADFDTSEMRFLTKPFIVGELGADKRSYGFNLALATSDMRARQVQSCQYPRPAKGWLFFTWDTDLVTSLGSMDLFYSLLDPNYNGAINSVLAPLFRPNPCV